MSHSSLSSTRFLEPAARRALNPPGATSASEQVSSYKAGIRLHPRTWLIWLGATVLILSSTRNPLYLFLILFCIAGVRRAWQGQSQRSRPTLAPWRFALLLVFFSAIFNSLTAHVGATELARLPARWPLLGGPITLEALAFGALNGLVLSGFLAAFSVLNLALPIHALVRLIPRAFYPIALVVSIAVAYVPATLSQLQQIREAQAVRGHQTRGLRNWLPLFMPLLISGLERALQLAEAMTARGFASQGEGHAARYAPSGQTLVLGLVALLGGLLLRLAWGAEGIGLSLMVAGGGLIGVELWLLSRQVQRTFYRPQRWTGRDWLVTTAAVGVALLFLAPKLGPIAAPQALQSIFYYPYPRLSLPPFNPVVGLTILGLSAPAWPLLKGSSKTC